MAALIAHDQKKAELVEFVIRHRDVFERQRLVATGSTGRLVGESERCFTQGRGGAWQLLRVEASEQTGSRFVDWLMRTEYEVLRSQFSRGAGLLS